MRRRIANIGYKIILLGSFGLALITIKSSYSQIQGLKQPLLPPTTQGPPALGSESNDHSSGFPVPRMVSLASDEANVRSGPGMAYPIRWVYHVKGLPLLIIAEYDSWRKTKDWEGSEGWIHEAVLNGKATVVVTSHETILRKLPAESSPAVARLATWVTAKLETCENSWCQVSLSSYSGWLKKSDIWGTAYRGPKG